MRAVQKTSKQGCEQAGREPSPAITLIICCLIAISFLRFGGQSSFGSALDLGRETPLERFKAFVASPPPIEKIVWYKLTTTEAASGIVVTNWPGTHRIVPSWFIARWQPPDCLSLIQPGNGGDLSAEGGGDLLGRRGSAHWLINRAGLVSYWEDPADGTRPSRLPPTLAFHSRASEFAELLNMGVMHIDPGTAKWTGENLAAEAYIPELKLPVEVRGSVVPTRECFAAEMCVQYRSRLAVWDYVIRYCYDTNSVSCFLPSKIESFFLSGGTERKMKEWNILSLKTRTTPIDRGSFALAANVATNRSRIFYYTNDAWYAYNALGRLVPMAGTALSLTAPLENLKTNNTYYVAIIVSTLFAFASVWRTKNKTKNATKNIIL